MRSPRKKIRKAPNYALRAIPIVIVLFLIVWAGWFAPWDRPSAGRTVLYHGRIMSPPTDRTTLLPGAAHTSRTKILKR